MDHQTHEKMIREAAQVAEMTKRFGLNLDYSDASIPGLEAFVNHLVKSAEMEGKKDDRQFTLNVTVKCGAYLGEVIRWKHGGEWVDTVPGHEEKLVALKNAAGFVFPMFMVTARMVKGPEVASLVKAFQQWTGELSRKRRISIAMTEDEANSLLRGAHPDRESLEAEMSADRQLAHDITPIVRMALMFAAEKWGLWLDFSVPSLQGVESILARLHELGQLPATPSDPKPTDEQIQEASLVWGFYLGEVIRRQLGGQWDLWKEGDRERARLIVKGFQLLPKVQAYKRIVNGPADNVAAFFDTARKTIPGAPRP